MTRGIQLFLSLLALLAIGMNLYAMFTGERIYALIAVFGLMPLVAILTLVFLARGQRRERERRFPGDGKTRDDSGDENSK
jgi:predicted lipid-binding transport protein (Tim44 family)